MVESAQDRKPNHRHLLPWLLLFLLFTIGVVPIVEYFRDARIFVHIGLTGVLLTAAGLTLHNRRQVVVAVSCAVAAVILSWMTLVVESPGLFLASTVFEALFLFAMAVFILITVLRQHLATIESIFGAIAAYLLIGFAFALVYWGIAFANPEALKFPEAVMNYVVADEEANLISEYSYFIYFSFVTMSTLGYGDVTPQTSIAQTLAWTQAVIGQFYIAVLVAWLVSEISNDRK